MTSQTQRRRRRASRAAVLAVLLAAVLAPGAAAAVTVGVTGTAPRQVLTLTSDGSSDVVLSFPDSAGRPGVAVSGGDEAVVAGPGCTPGPEPERAVCGVAADFERVVFAGGDGPDGLRVISATPLLPIEATGAGGDDDLMGGSGADALSGGPGDDVLDGGAGDDRLLGGAGDDQLDGGAGDDRLRGERGNDVVVGGAGRDDLAGGPGKDYLIAADGRADTVRCGSGRDVAVVDRHDRVHGCERIARTRARSKSKR